MPLAPHKSPMNASLVFPLFLLAPQVLSPPSDVVPTFITEGRGVQIYRCSEKESTYQWVFTSPEATLFDHTTHQQVAIHGAGPSWIWKDGSSIVGNVLQTTPSPDPASLPWLLLEAHTTGSIPGALTPITRIRRSDTHGGNPPVTGCDADHANAVARVPYTATYLFYR